MVALMGELGKFSLHSWQSKGIRCVVCSNLAGETLSTSDRIDNTVLWQLSFLCSPLGTAELNTPPLICVIDNPSLFDSLKSTKQVRDKTQVGDKQH